MKHIITAVLLALAFAAGLLLPQIFMEWQDRKLATPQLVSVTEPTLEWDSGKGLRQDIEEHTGEEVAHRLALFQAGPQATFPIGTATTDEMIWAASRAVEFLNMVCEAEPVINHSEAEFQLAWFEDGTTVAFWTAFVQFNDRWICIMTIDAETGAILQAIINPNGADLSELFPGSFERAAIEPGTSFEGLVSLRFCDALGHFMGRNDGVVNPVIPSIKFGTAYVTFADHADLRVETFFTVDLDGINFNNPGQYG